MTAPPLSAAEWEALCQGDDAAGALAALDRLVLEDIQPNRMRLQLALVEMASSMAGLWRRDVARPATLRARPR
jgi:hypothetical protein